MSKAYICDKCGKIVPSDVGEIHSLWTSNPFAVSRDGHPGQADLHLCAECYAQFEAEYLANLRENGGA